MHKVCCLFSIDLLNQHSTPCAPLACSGKGQSTIYACLGTCVQFSNIGLTTVSCSNIPVTTQTLYVCRVVIDAIDSICNYPLPSMFTNNPITTVPTGAFAGLTALIDLYWLSINWQPGTQLNIHNRRLNSISIVLVQANVFSGLTALQSLWNAG